MASRRAFTLIELLTVIAIVGVLMAITIPVVAGVRNSARTSKCAANLRALGLAGKLYADEHKGRFCSSRLYHAASHATEPGLIDYLDKTAKHEVFTCPSFVDYPFSEALDGIRHTYTLALVATDNPASWGNYPLRLVSKVQHPTRTAWMMDGAWVPASGWFSSAIRPTTADLAMLQYPHGQRQNVLFVDGHVERVAKDRLDDPTALIWTGVQQ
jgi:prepilin-type N-terminal cleavage/methylation domain